MNNAEAPFGGLTRARSERFLVLPVDLARIERRAIKIAKHNKLACGVDVTPKDFSIRWRRGLRAIRCNHMNHSPKLRFLADCSGLQK